MEILSFFPQSKQKHQHEVFQDMSPRRVMLMLNAGTGISEKIALETAFPHLQGKHQGVAPAQYHWASQCFVVQKLVSVAALLDSELRRYSVLHCIDFVINPYLFCLLLPLSCSMLVRAR
jgi:hypothetical protein